ncbi:4-oxalocrotonate tautomerase [Dinoroseobacter shibae DFL 12 = DSM 16493]|jgi:phenylpyruvate tautomerase PptA (4-oxalocrotonate tautomerase family)|uniref:4-oxalocrotonate tautomerase n=1 Tax=Dinoroseobacter shibae (strain DSM 16493 / NCIMB 14021 / DFL 12) TaxID=398580 RepID=A8LQF3_DINSH|nr:MULTISPECIES: nuclear transport factor 2 family protein [Dinoroseobacter]ABV92439.1 4-oxalocrotonate tautomerase [Dinoroseobacter shibae DFL 12 = DSM 16493]MDD9718304.1 nuclear transport factor 2 family protein [Dinoroseobacter sp. PD6]URF47383.1 nuclear transport factor 2 family protein [Dinoroseobacter shibae]URF51694.1 nuclear transport factor 2 family protein [Dinoroseobacter shibae]
MPVIEVHLIAGYGDEVKTRLGKALTDGARLVIPADPDGITVLTHEVAASGYMRGGQNRFPAPPLPDPAETVQAYLAAMEARDLDTAAGYLGAEFEMIFPGGVRMTDLDALVAWSAERYKRVTKTFEGIDTAPSETGAVVHCHGTLSGLWPDDTPFEGIRFIDRFELTDSKITRQEVWNDMAAAMQARKDPA